jgi:hypothetical protein
VTVIATGRTLEGDSWQLDVSTGSEPGELSTMVNVQLADGRSLWGGGCGGPAVYPGRRVSTYWGADDHGPRTLIARVTPDVRAVVVAMSDGTREDLILHGDVDALGARVAVLVYARGLDVHRVDLFGSSGEPLDLEA